jgi:hypothetical protein
MKRIKKGFRRLKMGFIFEVAKWLRHFGWEDVTRPRKPISSTTSTQLEWRSHFATPQLHNLRNPFLIVLIRA